MTPRRFQLLDWLLIASIAGALAAAAWNASRWWVARTRATAAHGEVATARDLVAAVERARALPPLLAESAPPRDQLALVTDTLGRAGVAASVLRRVQPEAEGAIERIEGVTLPVRRSSMRVELDGLTLPELGRFLATWRTQNPEWTPVLVTLSPRAETARDAPLSPQGVSQTAVQTAPRWTVSLSLATLYLAAPPPTPHQAPQIGRSSVPLGPHFGAAKPDLRHLYELGSLCPPSELDRWQGANMGSMEHDS